MEPVADRHQQQGEPEAQVGVRTSLCAQGKLQEPESSARLAEQRSQDLIVPQADRLVSMVAERDFSTKFPQGVQVS